MHDAEAGAEVDTGACGGMAAAAAARCGSAAAERRLTRRMTPSSIWSTKGEISWDLVSKTHGSPLKDTLL